MIRDVFVRGGEAITALEYYAKVYGVQPDEDACGDCRGARYVRYERAPGHPLFGQYTTCPRCVARPQTDAEPEPEKWWAK